VYFELPDGTCRHFLEVMQESMNEAMGDRKDGVARCIFEPEGRKLLMGGMKVPYLGIVADLQIISETETWEFVSNRIAELIVHGLKDADTVIFDDQIRRRNIDHETGEIT